MRNQGHNAFGKIRVLCASALNIRQWMMRMTSEVVLFCLNIRTFSNDPHSLPYVSLDTISSCAWFAAWKVCCVRHPFMRVVSSRLLLQFAFIFSSICAITVKSSFQNVSGCQTRGYNLRQLAEVVGAPHQSACWWVTTFKGAKQLVFRRVSLKLLFNASETVFFL